MAVARGDDNKNAMLADEGLPRLVIRPAPLITCYPAASRIRPVSVTLSWI